MSARKPAPGDVLTDIEDQGDNVSPRYGWSVGIIGTDGDRYDVLWGFEDTRHAARNTMRAAESALARRLTDRLTHPRKRTTSPACPPNPSSPPPATPQSAPKMTAGGE